MVAKLGYTLMLLLALPFVYAALGVIFLVSGTASVIEGIAKVWR